MIVKLQQTSFHHHLIWQQALDLMKLAITNIENIQKDLQEWHNQAALTSASEKQKLSKSSHVYSPVVLRKYEMISMNLLDTLETLTRLVE